MGFTMSAEDIGNRLPLGALDLFIEIDKFPAELRRQAPADCALAGAHETDQINASNCHSRHCTGCASLVVLLAFV